MAGLTLRFLAAALLLFPRLIAGLGVADVGTIMERYAWKFVDAAGAVLAQGDIGKVTVVQNQTVMTDIRDLLESAMAGFADPQCNGDDQCARGIMLSERNREEQKRKAAEHMEQHEKAVEEEGVKAHERLAQAKAAADEERRKANEMLQRTQQQREEAQEERAKADERFREAERLRQQAEQQRRRAEAEAEAARRRAAEEARRFSFGARGDPELCPEQNGKILKEHCVNYTGPAAAVCFDSNGGLQALHYIGVCNEDGSNHMGDDAWWVCEVWTLIYDDTGAKQWKFRNATGRHEALLTCDSSWQSELASDATPPDGWLDHFRMGKTFVLHEAQPRIMYGPKAGKLTEMMRDRNGLLEAKAQIRTGRVEDHLNAMLLVQGYAGEHGITGKGAALLMSFTLRYGLAMKLKP